MNGNILKITVIAIVAVLAAVSAAMLLGVFDDDNASDADPRHYGEGDQIRSTVRWLDVSGNWHVGKYVFTVIERGRDSLVANVVFNEGSKYSSQSIIVTKKGDQCTAVIEKFGEDRIVGFGWHDAEGLWKTGAGFVVHDGREADILSKVFEIACNAFTSRGDQGMRIDPNSLFDKPGETEMYAIVYLRAYQGLEAHFYATYEDGKLHRSTIIYGSSAVRSEDPALVDNFKGTGMCIEHVDAHIAGAKRDCLKVTQKQDGAATLVSFYTADGLLMLECRNGPTTVYSIDSISNG